MPTFDDKFNKFKDQTESIVSKLTAKIAEQIQIISTNKIYAN